MDKEIYRKGNINEITQYLDDATIIVKANYKKIFGKNFIGLFELLDILRKRYKHTPRFYSVMLSVDWEKEVPSYRVILDFKSYKRLISVNANEGKIGKWV